MFSMQTHASFIKKDQMLSNVLVNTNAGKHGVQGRSIPAKAFNNSSDLFSPTYVSNHVPTPADKSIDVKEMD